MKRILVRRDVPVPLTTRLTLGAGATAPTVFAVVVLIRELRDWPFALLLLGAAALVTTCGLTAGIDLRDDELGAGPQSGSALPGPSATFRITVMLQRPAEPKIRYRARQVPIRRMRLWV